MSSTEMRHGISDSFASYFEMKKVKISNVTSLDKLIVRRFRGNIGKKGLSFKVESGYLGRHHYALIELPR